MLPLLEIGSWQLNTYLIMATLAAAVGGLYAFERLLQLGYGPMIVARGLLFMFVSGLALSLLANKIINYWHIAHDGFLVNPESLDIFWALLGGGIAALFYIRRYRVSIGRVFDLGIPALPLALAIGRLGCTAAGCCFGRLTDSWLGFYMPDDQGVWALRYPTQPLAAAANLLIFFTLLVVERYGRQARKRTQEGGNGGWPFDGFLTLLFIFLFSVKRFVLAFLRMEGAPMGSIPLLGSLSWMHLNALVAGSVAGVLIVWKLYHQRRRQI